MEGGGWGGTVEGGRVGGWRVQVDGGGRVDGALRGHRGVGVEGGGWRGGRVLTARPEASGLNKV